MEFLDHIVVLFLIFWGASILFSVVTAPICTPSNKEFFPPHTDTCYFCLFKMAFLTSCFKFAFPFFSVTLLFWLRWVFVGAQLFWSCGEWCTDFSQWLLLLWSRGCRHAGFHSCGSWALGQKLVVVACRPSCSAAWGIFPDQGLNPCILPWQVDSLSLIHCGKPCISFKHFFKIIVGCIGPSFLPLGFFLQLRRGGAALCCSARASHYYSLAAEHRL